MKCSRCKKDFTQSADARRQYLTCPACRSYSRRRKQIDVMGLALELHPDFETFSGELWLRLREIEQALKALPPARRPGAARVMIAAARQAAVGRAEPTFTDMGIEPNEVKDYSYRR